MTEPPSTANPSGENPPTRSGSETRALRSLLSVVVIDLVGFGIIMPVLPYYADTFGASGTTLGLLFSTHAIFQAICAPLWGRLSDRIGRRPVLLGTTAGTSVALACLGFADSLPALFAARALSGVFAANVSVATAFISDATNDEERTRWMGLIGASFGIGFLLGPAVAALTLPFGYSAPMFTAAGLAAINCVWASRVLSEPTRRHAPVSLRGASKRILANPTIRGLCLANLAFAMGSAQLETMFPYFMKDRFDYEPIQFAWLLVAMAVVTAAVQGGGVRTLSKRLGERRMLVVGTAISALCLGLVPWMPTVAILIVPLLLSAVGRSIAQPAMMGLVSLAAPSAERGVVMGTYQSAASIARVIGPAAAGVLYDTAQAAPFLAASSLIAIAMVVGFRASQGLDPLRASAPSLDPV